jgi:hypothetical protein
MEVRVEGRGEISRFDRVVKGRKAWKICLETIGYAQKLKQHGSIEETANLWKVDDARFIHKSSIKP